MLTEAQREAKSAAYQKWYRANPELVKARNAANYVKGKAAISARTTLRYRSVDPKYYIFANKKGDAKRLGIAFSLDIEELVWPEVCPVLGITLEYRRGSKRESGRANSPSFDRIIQGGDYSHSNVLIVSHLANVLRSNRTPKELLILAAREDSEDLRKVANFYAALITSQEAQNVHKQAVDLSKLYSAVG